MRMMRRALLSMPELVAVSGLSESEIRRQMRRGLLKSRLICGRRRFVVADVETFLGVNVA